MKQILIITRKDLMPIVRKLRELNKKIEKLEEKIKTPACLYCGSIEVIRRGWRYNQNKKVQKYQCKNCKKKFSFSDNFPHMKNNADEILKALELRKEGKTLSQIAGELGNKVTRQTINLWLHKYQPPTEETTIKKMQKNQFGEFEREFKIKI
jgi:transposase-like protein